MAGPAFGAARFGRADSPPGRTKGRMSGKVAALFCAGVPDGQRTEDREDGGADPEPRDDRKVV